MIERFRQGPGRRSRVAVVSVQDGDDAVDTAAALARALASDARSVWIDAAFAKPRGTTQSGRGIADLVRGNATFGEIIARDRQSRAHFIAAGRSDANDLSMLATDRLSVALDALERTYEHVTIDAGSLRDVPAGYVGRLANSVVLVVPESAEASADQALDSLREAGCTDVLVVIAPLRTASRKPEPAAAA